MLEVKWDMREEEGWGGKRKEEEGWGGKRRDEEGWGGMRWEEEGWGGKRWDEEGRGGKRRDEVGWGGKRRDEVGRGGKRRDEVGRGRMRWEEEGWGGVSRDEKRRTSSTMYVYLFLDGQKVCQLGKYVDCLLYRGRPCWYHMHYWWPMVLIWSPSTKLWVIVLYCVKYFAIVYEKFRRKGACLWCAL